MAERYGANGKPYDTTSEKKVEEKKEAKISNVKDKLSLSDEDWEDLKEALK